MVGPLGKGDLGPRLANDGRDHHPGEHPQLGLETHGRIEGKAQGEAERPGRQVDYV